MGDQWQIIVALASVISGLAGFIALQFKQQLSGKDERIGDKDRQIAEGKAREERLFMVAETNGKGLTESINLLKEVQETAEAIERELTISRQPANTIRRGQGRQANT